MTFFAVAVWGAISWSLFKSYRKLTEELTNFLLESCSQWTGASELWYSVI